ncbi:hypothetical protein [Pelagimonas varians]|uniref:Uncharacterized protein n=1 Tax=Pelagimonas varians TaxID=696760 RepID=A0A238K8A9_9RHOB|nr:hypothetical protein [Pelagimonas varians]PYG31735.1 hypothetical protein C8N36_104155 [Pelagimonas varians]SMX38684.1 hypothetical protein PEV8663_01489 [Pelagimonas varians]
MSELDPFAETPDFTVPDFAPPDFTSPRNGISATPKSPRGPSFMMKEAGSDVTFSGPPVNGEYVRHRIKGSITALTKGVQATFKEFEKQTLSILTKQGSETQDLLLRVSELEEANDQLLSRITSLEEVVLGMDTPDTQSSPAQTSPLFNMEGE